MMVELQTIYKPGHISEELAAVGCYAGSVRSRESLALLIHDIHYQRLISDTYYVPVITCAIGPLLRTACPSSSRGLRNRHD